MNYSLISIAWKKLENIKQVIENALNSTLIPNEIIVIINPYNDQDTSEIRNFIKTNKNITRWVDCSDNIGCATAWNLGIHISNSDYCIIVNDDCMVGKNTYRNMMNEFQDPTTGIIGVELKGFENDKIKSPAGFLFAVRKQCILDLGGFKEIASPLADEVELALRIASNGYSIKQASGCEWSHTYDISTNYLQDIKYLGQYINIRERQLRIEPKLKQLQEKYNSIL